jgi:Na+/H+ antiporter NhaD/arsenite permease-like protein
MSSGEEKSSGSMTTRALIHRLMLLCGLSFGLAWSGRFIGLNHEQQIASGVFLASIMGTLLFWNLRLGIAFLGLGVLVFTRSLNMEQFVSSAELPVILFLVGMMIVVGALRDLGLFTWIVQSIIALPNMTARRFIGVTAVVSALLACAVDEVTSIIIISTLVFQVCNRLKLNPAPVLIICVLCTNVGSAGTMMGNPVGIFIGSKAGFTFGDFMIWSFPIMLVCLALTVVVTMWWYRKDLEEFDRLLQDRFQRGLSLTPVVDVPYGRGLVVLIGTILMIALHHPLEQLLGLEKNIILHVAPLICAGLVMIYRRDRAREYVEREVDWWTLLFFMLLFAVAGALKHSEVTSQIASKFIHQFGRDVHVLIPTIMVSSAIGSALVDNVIFVAAYAPIIEA